MIWLALGCGRPAEPPVDRAPGSVLVARTVGSRTVVARAVPEGHALFVDDGAGERILVPGEWTADRPALSEDGRRVAFVSGRSGLASVWVVEVVGGAPRQVTNVGVRRRKGEVGAPEGFVPPPGGDDLRFEGGALTWTSADGARWRVVP